MPTINDRNFIDFIVAYQQGELDDEQALELFAFLVRTGRAWSLHKHISSTATALIRDGKLSSVGEILVNHD